VADPGLRAAAGNPGHSPDLRADRSCPVGPAIIRTLLFEAVFLETAESPGVL